MGDFYDVVSVASDEMNSAAMYYHMLNVGTRLPATGGTDNFSNVWRDPSGGTARTYARISGPLTWRNWIEAVRAGHTIATSGPLLFANVDGQEPGSALSSRGGALLLLGRTGGHKHHLDVRRGPGGDFRHQGLGCRHP